MSLAILGLTFQWLEALAYLVSAPLYMKCETSRFVADRAGHQWHQLWALRGNPVSFPSIFVCCKTRSSIMTIHNAPQMAVGRTGTIPVAAFGLSLSAFFAITYLLCVALRLVVPDIGNHIPWFQFFPGFSWTLGGVLLGFVESVAYGWYVALVFGWLFNFFAARRD
jgi:hypothetical protein